MSAAISTELSLGIAGFLAPLKRVSDSIVEFRGSIMAVQTAFQGITALGGTIASTFSSIGTRATETLDLGGQFNDLHTNSGQAISDLVVLGKTFENNGLKAEGTAAMMARFQKALAGVNEEGEPTNAVLESMGFNVAQLKMMPIIDGVRALQQAFIAIPTDADRTAKAMALFGKSGSKMLALLTDEGAIDQARDQVGGFAAVMEDASEAFDALGDNLATVGQKSREVAAGALSQIAPAFIEITDRLSRVDMTDFGRSIGEAANGCLVLGQTVGSIASALSYATPYLLGFGAAWLAVRFSGSAAGMALQNQITALTMAIRNPGEAISALRIKYGAELSTMRALTTSAAAAMRTALSTIGTGAILTGATLAFSSIMDRAASLRQGTTTVGQLSGDFGKQALANIEKMRTVASSGEKDSFISDLNTQLTTLRDKVRSVDQDYSSLGETREADAARADIRNELELEAETIAIQIRKTQELEEKDYQRAREIRRALELRQAEQKALEDLGEAYDKLVEKQKDAAFDALSPTDQKKKLLADAGVQNDATLDRNLTNFDLRRQNGSLTAAEAVEAQRLLAIKTQLVEVEKKIATERQKAADKAKDDAKEQAKKDQETKEKRAQFSADSKLELGKIQAEARGDTKEVERIDRVQRYNAAFKEARDTGLGTQEADSFARQKVAAEDAKTQKDEKDKQGDRIKSLAAEEARGIGVSNMQRIGGGGGTGGNDALLRENQRQTRELATQSGMLKEAVAVLKSIHQLRSAGVFG